MKILNEKATEIFCQIMNRMEGGNYLKITKSPYMPLTVERIDEGIKMPSGTGDVYSFCHYFTQNGDLMQDPEMCFIVVDKRNGDASICKDIEIIPYSYELASLGIYAQSIRFRNNEMCECNVSMQREQADYAESWLLRILENGYLTGEFKTELEL